GETQGHWRYTIIDAYTAVLPPGANDAAGINALLGEQIAGVAFASQHKTPAWFTTGTARVIASRIDGKDPRVAAWNDQLAAAMAGVSNVDEFLQGRLPP